MAEIINELEEREERAGEDMSDPEITEKEPLEVAGQPPKEKRSLLHKLRKVLGRLSCMC